MHSQDSKFIRILNISPIRTCNYNCSWCNQRQDLTKPAYDTSESVRLVVDNKIRPGDDWINGLNNFPYKDQFERLVIYGGEPSVHPDFFKMVSHIKGYPSVTVVTNLSFDVTKLIKVCQENDAHPMMQTSFQFEHADFDEFLAKIKLLDKHQLLSPSIPVSIVDLPDRKEPREFMDKFKKHGFEVTMFEFEGYYKGRFEYADVDGFGSKGVRRRVVCCSECINVKPNGDIVFCPTDAYRTDVQVYGNICDQLYKEIPTKRVCPEYGMCHISSAAWIKVESLEEGKTIWTGKNFRVDTAFIRAKNHYKNIVFGLFPGVYAFYKKLRTSTKR